MREIDGWKNIQIKSIQSFSYFTFFLFSFVLHECLYLCLSLPRLTALDNSKIVPISFQPLYQSFFFLWSWPCIPSFSTPMSLFSALLVLLPVNYSVLFDASILALFPIIVDLFSLAGMFALSLTDGTQIISIKKQVPSKSFWPFTDWIVHTLSGRVSGSGVNWKQNKKGSNNSIQLFHNGITFKVHVENKKFLEEKTESAR